MASSSNSVVSQWDLIVGVAGYVSKPVNNTPVLVCLSEAWNTPCFTGTYITSSNGKGYVLVHNGNNNNRGSLYPLNNNNVRVYSIISAIPRVVWISLLALYFTLLSILLVKSIEIGYKLSLRDSRVFVLALVLSLSVNSILVGGVYIDQATPRYTIPGVSVNWSFHYENSTLVVILDLGEIYTLVNTTCVLKLAETGNKSDFANNKNTGINSVLEVQVVSNNTVLVIIPGYAYEYLYNKTVLEPIPLTPVNLSVYATIPVSCKFKLDKGVLQATFIAEFYWRDLVLGVRDTLVEIHNPNQVFIETKIYILDLERGVIVNTTSVCLKPLDTINLDLSIYGTGKYRVLVQYTLLGLRRSRVAYVDVS